MASSHASAGARPAWTDPAQTLIIGAGLSGLTAAWRLSEAGLRPVVFEKSPCFGGQMRSIRRADFIVDLGCQELPSFIPEVDALWSALLGEDYRTYQHRVGSLYRGRILEISPSFRGVRRGMPLTLFATGGVDLFRTKLFAGLRKPRDYEEYRRQRTGRRFARALGQGYWEKVGGERWRDLPVPESADGQAVWSGPFTSTAPEGGWRHPARGAGQICGALMERLREAEIEVHFDSEVVRVERNGDRIAGILVQSGSDRIWFPARNVISSVQTDQLVALLGGLNGHEVAPRRQRAVVLAYLFLSEPPRFPHVWLEVNDTALTCGRITNYAAFNGDMVPSGRTALCVEFFLHSGDPRLDRSDEEWTHMAIGECASAALIDAAAVSDSMVCRLDRCEAPSSGNSAGLQVPEDMLPYPNLYNVNRHSADGAAHAGLMAAEAILSGDRQSFDRHADPARSYAAG